MRYAKFILAFVAAAAYAAQAAISDGTITNQEWIGIAIAAATAVGVWAIPNKPPVDEAREYLRSTMGQTTK